MASERRRLEALSELYNSEKAYLDDLYMWEKFKKYLLNCKSLTVKRRYDLAELTFINTESIIKLHESILKDMIMRNKECYIKNNIVLDDGGDLFSEESKEQSNNGDDHKKRVEYKIDVKNPDIFKSLEYFSIYDNNFEKFSAYKEYAYRLPKGEFEIEKENEINSQFKNEVDEFFYENKISDLGIRHYLFRPTQKLPRYAMLFKAIQKNEKDTEYSAKIAETSNNIRSLTKEVDKIFGDMNNYFKLYKLSKELRYIHEIENKMPLGLFSRKRKFIREGEVFAKNEFIKHPRELRFLLFDHIILLCDVISQYMGEAKYIVSEPLVLVNYVVIDKSIGYIPDDLYIKQLYPLFLLEKGGSKITSLFFKDVNLRNLYFADIKTAIEKAKALFSEKITLRKLTKISNKEIEYCCTGNVNFNERKSINILAQSRQNSQIEHDESIGGTEETEETEYEDSAMKSDLSLPSENDNLNQESKNENKETENETEGKKNHDIEKTNEERNSTEITNTDEEKKNLDAEKTKEEKNSIETMSIKEKEKIEENLRSKEYLERQVPFKNRNKKITLSKPKDNTESKEEAPQNIKEQESKNENKEIENDKVETNDNEKTENGIDETTEIKESKNENKEVENKTEGTNDNKEIENEKIKTNNNREVKNEKVETNDDEPAENESVKTNEIDESKNDNKETGNESVETNDNKEVKNENIKTNEIEKSKNDNKEAENDNEKTENENKEVENNNKGTENENIETNDNKEAENENVKTNDNEKNEIDNKEAKIENVEPNDEKKNSEPQLKGGNPDNFSDSKSIKLHKDDNPSKENDKDDNPPKENDKDDIKDDIIDNTGKNNEMIEDKQTLRRKGSKGVSFLKEPQILLKPKLENISDETTDGNNKIKLHMTPQLKKNLQDETKPVPNPTNPAKPAKKPKPSRRKSIMLGPTDSKKGIGLAKGKNIEDVDEPSLIAKPANKQFLNVKGRKLASKNKRSEEDTNEETPQIVHPPVTSQRRRNSGSSLLPNFFFRKKDIINEQSFNKLTGDFTKSIKNNESYLIYSTEDGIYKKTTQENIRIGDGPSEKIIYDVKNNIIIYLQDTLLYVSNFQPTSTQLSPVFICDNITNFFYGSTLDKNIIAALKLTLDNTSSIVLFSLEEENDVISVKIHRTLYIGSLVYHICFLQNKMVIACKDFEIVDSDTLKTQELIDSLDPIIPYYFQHTDTYLANSMHTLSHKTFLVCYDQLAFIIDSYGRSIPHHNIFPYTSPKYVKTYKKYLAIITEEDILIYDIKTSDLLFRDKQKNMRFVDGTEELIMYDDMYLYKITIK
ncbi:hypothetical protein SLOPH_2317 [Spraguea lophii 42_110]|uniref:DH domain-containing protein n=1 Tax=Spraguea lophii (strain 42_110) TaxID=1358809 RepID=S7W591_SPRLO|nr:hypothetical protein SLOPH_2317 [Spraguea lophii 42_110]